MLAVEKRDGACYGMTSLRFVSGVVWLTAASAWMLFVPCARLRRSKRFERRDSDRLARKDTIRSIEYACSGILLGLGFLWWEYFLFFRWGIMLALWLAVMLRLGLGALKSKDKER